MRGELKRLQQELGTTTVYVTHDQAEAMTLGHRVAVLDQGKLQQFDTPLEIYNHPLNRFVAEFVGSPSMNFIDGEIDSHARTFRTSRFTMALTEAEVRITGAATLGIRPEHIDISTTQSDGWWPATVYVTELMGSETFVITDLDNQRIVARADANFSAEIGTTVWLNFDMLRAHWFDAETGVRV